ARKTLTALNRGSIIGATNGETTVFDRSAAKMIKYYFGIVAFFLCGSFFPSTSFSQQSLLQKPCVDCHGSEPRYPVRGVRSQYLTSGHRTLGNAHYANADDCQGCHTNEGFIERIKTGKVDVKKVVSNTSEIGCFTCHAPHDKSNFSLRTVSKVTLANGVTFDR